MFGYSDVLQIDYSTDLELGAFGVERTSYRDRSILTLEKLFGFKVR